ncbi:hypothetical protein [Pseudomonas sp. FME51]|uniref:hypothetical protein n=1 Tax=Pseudomonas sp. FME51 TaxID=2742609 RepID=UPI001865D9D5|nr:hypothetical protein [Pseudomonas sp. FME51]
MPYQWIRDPQELEFAKNYLQRHASDEAWRVIKHAIESIDREDPQKWGLAVLEAVDRTDSKLLSRLHSSVRQFRARHTSTGRKQRSFSLPDATWTALSKLASIHGMRPAEIVTDLVSEASKALRKLEQKHQEKLKDIKRKQEHEQLRYELRAAIQEEQINELKNTLLLQVRQLVMWEESMGECKPPYDGETQLIEALSGKRVEELIKESGRRAEIGALVLPRPLPD